MNEIIILIKQAIKMIDKEKPIIAKEMLLKSIDEISHHELDILVEQTYREYLEGDNE